MPLARRLITMAAALIGVLLLVVAAALLALQTNWGRNQVRALAERQASSALGAHVAIERLEGSLLYGVSIDRLSVTDEGHEIVSATRVSARYDIFDLIRGTFALDEIVLDGPVVQAEALVLLGREEPEDPAPTLRTFSIGRIVVTDGLVIVGPEPAAVGGVEIPDVLRDVQAELSVSFGPDEMRVAVKHLSFVGESPGVTLQRLAGTVVVDGDDLVLEGVSVQLAESSMTVSGTVDNFRGFGGPDAMGDEMDYGRSVAAVDRRP